MVTEDITARSDCTLDPGRYRRSTARSYRRLDCPLLGSVHEWGTPFLGHAETRFVARSSREHEQSPS